MANWIEQLPKSIMGIHDIHDMSIWGEKRGWVLHVEAIGHDPNNRTSIDLSGWEEEGFGTICRIQHGWNPDGCIPLAPQYGDFALRVRNFVEVSIGCHIWIIGNEMNHRIEWPNEQPIHPWDYAVCYDLCRSAIHSLPGHENDWVCVGAVAPWNAETTYGWNERGDWIQYLEDTIVEIETLGSNIDAVSIHTYTHGSDPILIQTHRTMAPPFEDRYYEFPTYKQFVDVIPKGVPIFITETNQDGPWLDEQNGWLTNAYAEIDTWNQYNKDSPIWALIPYRWQGDKYEFYNKGNVIEEFKSVLTLNYERPTKEPPMAEWEEVYRNEMNVFYDYQSPELTVPVGSVPLWEHDKDNGQLDRPEYDRREPRHTYNSPYAAGMFSMHTTMEAAIVFEIPVKPGDEVRASVFANGIIDQPNPQMALRAGIATSNPGAGAIEVQSGDGKFTGVLEGKAAWGEWFSDFSDNQWGLLWTPVVTATGSKVWILLNGRKDFAHPGHTHWDQLSVEVKSGGVTPEPPEPPNPSDLGDQIREVANQLDALTSDLNLIANKVDDMESSCSEEAKAEVAEARSLLDEALSKM